MRDPLASPREMARVTAGRWTREPGRAIRGAAIDSREVGEGDCFFALPGTRTDGHAFVGDALARGASCAVVRTGWDPCTAPEGAALLVVDDVLDAMEALARARRRAMRHVRVVGVTGSVGKTTTTRMIAGVLGQAMTVSASARSHNNRLGTCLTMLNADPAARVLVSEVGMSEPGEIARRCALLEPACAVITAIGEAHLERLGSIEAIAREKAQIADSLHDDGLLVMPAGCPALERFVRTDASIVRLGDDLVIEETCEDDGGVRLRIGARWFRVPMIGVHNASNAACAIAVGRWFGLSDDQIASGLARVRAPEMRMQCVRVGGVRIINDAYNANPVSMRAALASLRARVASRRVCVLGDMLELGEASARLHEAMGASIVDSGADLAILVGREMARAAPFLRGRGVPCEVFEEGDEEAMRRIAGLLRDGDLVLVKGSRGMRMERLLGVLGAGVHAAGVS